MHLFFTAVSFTQHIVYHSTEIQGTPKTKKKKTHFKETEQASEPESEMTRVLELLDQKWKT